LSTHNPTIIVPAKPADKETRRRAAKLFPLLQKSKKLGRQQPAAKLAEWVELYAGMLEAKRLGGALRVPTGNRNINNAVRRKVLAAAIDTEVFKESPRVSVNCRRLFGPGRKWA
jgi:hypothetical protein